MNALFRAGLEFQQFLQEKDWRFCFIGGIAVLRWGESRMTQDVDLSLLTGFGNEKTYVDALLAAFRSRVADAREFALANRVLLLHASNEAPVDVSLAAIPFEEEMVARATPFSYAPGCSLITCSAEDLLILKAFADRPNDWADVEGILRRQGPRLDFGRIIGWLTPLCALKDAPDIVDKLRRLAENTLRPAS